jgi:hypothetical protein
VRTTIDWRLLLLALLQLADAVVQQTVVWTTLHLATNPDLMRVLQLFSTQLGRGRNQL